MKENIDVKKITTKIKEWAETTDNFIPILLVIAGILLLYQFLIVIVGPLCLFLGIWLLYANENRKSEKDTDHQ